MMEPPQHQMEFRDHGPVPPPALDRERRFFDSFRLEPPFGNLLLAIILMGANVLIKLQFRSVKKLHRLKELEKQHVETELAYLKSQINPHFFMNTLNNIHALINVDSNKAKETVIELSKLMRYLLYESSQPTIPLSKEINFLAHFVELMKLRYTDEVEIVMELPEEVPTSIDVPPLLFLPFLENAFKHGVSYRRKSYIHFSLKVEGQNLVCVVKNSNNARIGDKLSGIGLENVRKRLQLLYEDRYSLNVSTTEEEFAVVLVCSYSQHSSKP
jgi:Putative regulator of cell autolysis